MSAAKVAAMHSEVPFDLFHLQIDDFLTPEQDSGHVPHDLDRLPFTEQLAILFDEPPVGMLAESVTARSPASATIPPSPCLSACSSPPGPATPRSTTPPSVNVSAPPSPRERRPSSTTGSPPGGGPMKTQKVPRHKRESHIRAEHRRRHKIQTGLGDLQKYVPSIMESANNNVKDSKVVMLNKTSQYIAELVAETNKLQAEVNRKTQEWERHKAEANISLQKLPPNGLEFKSTKPSTEGLDDMFKNFLRSRTLQNSKFIMLNLLSRPLFEAYKNEVKTTSTVDFKQSVQDWTHKHCSLFNLRQNMFESVRKVSQSTSIMNDPSRFREEVAALVINDQIDKLDTDVEMIPESCNMGS